MPRQGQRKRIAKYIYADPNGTSGVVIVRGHREELRFPLGVTVQEIRRAMEARRHQLEQQFGDAPARGSLADVVERYLRTLPAGAHKDQREDLLTPWVNVVGPRPFVVLSRTELAAVTEQWRHAGLSASRLNKRISVIIPFTKRVHSS